jgi:thiamine pyrophosphate-dependent acetolactate synthase large subunit-like protein
MVDGVAAWGSDRIAVALRALEIEFIALTPGSSFRGLHDSLVNHLGNRDPQIILCLHEEHAVAIAHAYAKVTGRAMAVALHSNVGLMHATMAVFNAFCDRVPVLLIGGAGPLDATRRRPWIDWLHTSTDQAALIRPFIKWDDQPGSVAAAVASLLQGHQLAMSEPCAPVYVALDVTHQEARLEDQAPIPDPEAHVAPLPAHPAPAAVATAAQLLEAAARPVLLVGRTSRSSAAWSARIRLAERVGAEVFTHLELPAAFPTTHPLFAGMVPHVEPSEELLVALQAADLVLSLDWLDLGGTLRRAWGDSAPASVISISLDAHLHRGWGKEHFAAAPAVLRVAASPDAMVDGLLDMLGQAPPTALSPPPAAPRLDDLELGHNGQLTTAHIAASLRSALDGRAATLARAPGAWTGDLWPCADPLDFLGGDGGGGIGSGPGMAVGAALALRDDERLAVAVLGDGDFAMGASALWTAAHYRLPLLIVIANNRSFLNDEIHQHRVAAIRGRATENRWIGQRLEGPEIDHATVARGHGAAGIGPLRTVPELERRIRDAVTAASRGPVVVDVWVANEPHEPAPRVG